MPGSRARAVHAALAKIGLGVLVAIAALVATARPAAARPTSDDGGEVSTCALANAAAAALPIMSLLAPAPPPRPTPSDDGPGCWRFGSQVDCSVHPVDAPPGAPRAPHVRVADMLLMPTVAALPPPGVVTTPAVIEARHHLAAGHARRLERPPRHLTVPS